MKSLATDRALDGSRDEPLLILMQLFDSQFPIGGFAHSGGLETYAQMDLDVEGLRDLLRVQILRGWGRLDLATAALAWRDALEPDALEALCYEVDAWKPIEGLRATSLKLGRRLLRLARRLWPEVAAEVVVPLTHQPVVAGALSRRLGLPQRPFVLAFGQSTLIAALTAATRCMPLSPERAQELMIELRPTLTRAVAEALRDPARAMNAATPGADLRAHQQALLYTRLFQS